MIYLIRITEKDIELLSFLKKYKVMFVRDGERIYSNRDYGYKRIKRLEESSYIKKVDWYKVKLDVNGIKLLKEIGYDYKYICRNQEYQIRIEEIAKIAGLTLGSDIRIYSKLGTKRYNGFY